MSLKEGPHIENILFDYEIFNNGPSVIREFSISLQIPISYKFKPDVIRLLNVDEIKTIGFYAEEYYEVTWVNMNVFQEYDTEFKDFDHKHTESFEMRVNKEDSTLKNLPKNRTIYQDCTPKDMDECIEAQFTIRNFRPGDDPVALTLNFSLDLKNLGKSY